MSLPPTVQTVIVNASAKSYILISQDATKVRCKGEVIRVSGCSAMHGPDKVFLKSKVTICEPRDLTEDMLYGMYWQEKPRSERPDAVKPAKEKRVKQPREKKPKKHPLANFVPDSLYGSRYGGRGYWELTDKAWKQLMAEGEDVAWDGLGNYLDEGTLQDAAMDAASYHPDFTEAGMPEGYNQGREAVADAIYDGMLKGLKRVKAEGRSTTMPRNY